MGRPKRRGGGRVTPKTKRVHFDDELGSDFVFQDRDYRYEAQWQLPDADPHSGFQLNLLARDAECVLEEISASGTVDMNEVDYWSSCIQTAIVTTRSPDGVEPSAVLTHAERVGGPVGAVLAAAVSVYGPPDARPQARRRLRRIRESHADVPAWIEMLGKAEPLRATSTTDRWGEHCEVCIDYRRPDGTEHGVSVSIEPFCLGMATRFTLGAPSTQRATTVSKDQIVEELGLADARAIVTAGLEVRGGFGIDEDGSIADFDEDLWALLEQRLELLPEGGRAPDVSALGAEEGAAHFTDFFSRGPRLGEHPDEMHDLGRTMFVFAMVCRDRDFLRWTPLRVAVFLEDWLPENGLFCRDCNELHEHPPDEEWFSTVESVFPRWLRYAAGRSGLSDDALKENLAAARGPLKQMRRRATDSPR
ncbi:MAG: hypothetical protein OXB92_13340 [Acidimicrobiaceae bacterium]|nr:hypothetical protein [Acidimicrobiia bacterium]MCY4494833.1 hypothetical protein [Acidimicrobiaceae bacterium]